MIRFRYWHKGTGLDLELLQVRLILLLVVTQLMLRLRQKNLQFGKLSLEDVVLLFQVLLHLHASYSAAESVASILQRAAFLFESRYHAAIAALKSKR